MLIFILSIITTVIIKRITCNYNILTDFRGLKETVVIGAVVGGIITIFTSFVVYGTRDKVDHRSETYDSVLYCSISEDIASVYYISGNDTLTKDIDYDRIYNFDTDKESKVIIYTEHMKEKKYTWLYTAWSCTVLGNNKKVIFYGKKELYKEKKNDS